MRGSKCPGLPCVDVARDGGQSRGQPRQPLRRARRARQPSAVITLVPFMSARLSFGARASGSRPARRGPRRPAAPARRRSPRARRRGSRPGRRAASGRRSRRRSPRSGMRGSTRWLSRSQSALEQRDAHPRVALGERDEPQCDDRGRLDLVEPIARCRSRGSASGGKALRPTVSGGMAFWTEAPTPVVTP